MVPRQHNLGNIMRQEDKVRAACLPFFTCMGLDQTLFSVVTRIFQMVKHRHSPEMGNQR